MCKQRACSRGILVRSARNCAWYRFRYGFNVGTGWQGFGVVRICIGVMVVAVLLGVATSSAPASFPSQQSYVSVASGQVGGQTWSLKMRGHQQQRCFWLNLEPTTGHGEVCQSDDPPSKLWQHVFGASNTSASAELEITSTRVWRLKLLFAHPGRSKKHLDRTSVRTRMISQGRKARRAHLETERPLRCPDECGALICGSRPKVRCIFLEPASCRKAPRCPARSSDSSAQGKSTRAVIATRRADDTPSPSLRRPKSRARTPWPAFRPDSA